ncbi:MAG: dipeptidase [Planctomycetota bacterium]|nr:MAG: dipeptidase [Planctomycetota bacterium]
MSIEAAKRYAEEHFDDFLDDLKQLLRIPSVSADPRHREDMQRAAEFVRDRLAAAGVETRLVATDGFPIVYGERLRSDDRPTALVYGHYDVQPPDPVDQWVSPPFEPVVREGCVWARGATDDKGQLFTHIAAVHSWTTAAGELPVNVKFVIEGEEEVGSRSLETFLQDNRELLSADVAVVSDTSQYGDGIPAITYGLRGITACEVTVRGPRQDLHSGVFGGAVANPANVLARLIGSLVGPDGRIAVSGFYDAVRPIGEEERRRLAALPFDEQAFLREVGVPASFGEPEFSILERRWCRPSCDVNGLVSGYTGEGPKTIIPQSAVAKVSFRLVPDQDPDAVLDAVERHLRERCPPAVTLQFRRYHGCPGVVIDTDSAFMQAARRAIRAGFGADPVLIREGGSIPVVASFRAILGVDTLLLGWGRNSDNLHAPNEHFHLDDFRHGMLASVALWDELARCGRQRRQSATDIA